MIAEILPLRALPRGLAFFSYAVPPELQDILQPGQCVKIPFQSTEILGLIGKISHTTPTRSLKNIISIINAEPLLGQDYLVFLEKLAIFYGTSLPTILKRALPPLQPQKIGQEIISPWQTKPNQTRQPDYFWYTNTSEHQTALASYPTEKIIIIVPEVKYMEFIKADLPPSRQKEVVIWGADISVKDERELWFKIRTNQVHTVIATRSALWWPLNQCFDRIIVDCEHHENHKQADQSPRFSTKDLAKLHAKYFGIAYTEMSFSPSITSYFFIQEKRYHCLLPDNIDTTSSPTIVYPDSGQKSTPIFSPTVSIIETTLEKNPEADIVLIYNQTRPGKFGFCRECATTVPTPLPTTCPACNSTQLIELGNTINSVAKLIQKELTEHAVEIITFDKNTLTLPPKKGARIIVGTWAALTALSYDTITVVAILDFTRQALFPDYLTHEQLRHRIRELQFFLKTDTELIIQTETASHPVLATLQNNEAWYEGQLQERASLGYPPYAYLVRYLIPGKTEADCLQQAHQYKSQIEFRLTKEPKNLTIQGPILTSGHFQGKAWAVLMLKIAEADILSATTWVNHFFTPECKIDPNPISLFSPH